MIEETEENKDGKEQKEGKPQRKKGDASEVSLTKEK